MDRAASFAFVGGVIRVIEIEIRQLLRVLEHPARDRLDLIGHCKRPAIIVGPIPALCRRNKFSSRSDEPASDIDIAAVNSESAWISKGRLEKRTSLLCAMRPGGEVYIFCHLEDGARPRLLWLIVYNFGSRRKKQCSAGERVVRRYPSFKATTAGRSRLNAPGFLSADEALLFAELAAANVHLTVTDAPLLACYVQSMTKIRRLGKLKDVSAWEKTVRVTMALGEHFA
jgi:hypothetical protein